MSRSIVFALLLGSLPAAEPNYSFPFYDASSRVVSCYSCFPPESLSDCEVDYANFYLSDSCESCGRIIRRETEKYGYEGCRRKLKYPEHLKFADLASKLREEYIRNRTAIPSAFLESDGDRATQLQPSHRLFNTILRSHHVQLVNYTAGTVCGGAMVSPYHILTAARCLHNLATHGAENLALYVGGKGGFARGDQLRSVKKVFVHPEFEKGKSEYDIALININQDYTKYTKNGYTVHINHGYTPYTKHKISTKIQLPTENVQPGDKGTVTGFGKYRYDVEAADIYPDGLRSAELIVRSKNESSFLTIGRVGPLDIGDPLFLKRNGQLELIGILKGTEVVDEITYLDFVNLWALKNWIATTIEESWPIEILRRGSCENPDLESSNGTRAEMSQMAAADSNAE